MTPHPRHGGNLAWAQRQFPGAPRPWIDLSTGINPIPWPGREGEPMLQRLPDPHDLAKLEAAAAGAFEAEATRVAAVPGAEIGLRLLPAVLGAKDVAVVSPTYTSHADAWASSGATIRSIDAAAIVSTPAKAVIVVNPNNPDGRTVQPAILDDAAARLEAVGGWLIADESFVEVAPKLSLAGSARNNVIVLRSFGKFYGLPDLRLGFVIAPPAIISRYRAFLGDWPVSTQAIAIGRRAYRDTAWQGETRKRLVAAAADLDRLLQAQGLEVAGGTALFRLVQTADAARVFRTLAAQGILVRAFADRPQWLRFSLPPQSAWARLEDALARTMK